MGFGDWGSLINRLRAQALGSRAWIGSVEGSGFGVFAAFRHVVSQP